VPERARWLALRSQPYRRGQREFRAFYDKPWWRADGLSGFGMGLSPVFLTLDVGGGDVSEGELAGFLPVNGEIAARYSDELSDPERAKELFLRQSAEYLGDGAAEPNEVYGFGSLSDSWSTGCSVGLPPGVLSTVGSALRRPIPPCLLGRGRDRSTTERLDGGSRLGWRKGGRGDDQLPRCWGHRMRAFHMQRGLCTGGELSRR
jgi:monoamine oxidase